jgi:hypothetical protein
MREIRMSGSEGGGIRNQLILPTRILNLTPILHLPPSRGKAVLSHFAQGTKGRVIRMNKIIPVIIFPRQEENEKGNQSSPPLKKGAGGI